MLAEVSQLVWTLVYGGLLTLLFSGWVALADAWVVCFGLWSNAQRRASRLMSYWGVKERVTCGCQGMWCWALSPKFSASLWRRTVVHGFMQRWKGDSDLCMSGNVILGAEPWFVYLYINIYWVTMNRCVIWPFVGGFLRRRFVERHFRQWVFLFWKSNKADLVRCELWRLLLDK